MTCFSGKLGRGDREPPRSREETEVRVLRALATERQPGLVKGIRVGYRVAWPEYREDPVEDEDLESLDLSSIDVFLSDPRDRDDWYIALRWFGALNQPGDWNKHQRVWTYNKVQRLIRWRSYGLMDCNPPSWEWIGHRERMSESSARREYQWGVDQMWRAAQGLAVQRDRRVRDRAEKLFVGGARASG